MPQMTIQLYDRRKTMLDLYYAGVPQTTIITQICDKEGIKRKTALEDWYRRERWEPLIWRMEASTDDAQQILYSLRLGRERALTLMRTADNDNAKVGAIGKLTDVVSKEIELRQSLGALPKMAEKLEVEQTIKQKQEVLWNELTEEERNVFRMCASIRRAHSAKERPSGIH